MTVNWGDFIVVQAREWPLVAWVGWGMVLLALVTGLEELTVIVKSLVPWSWGRCSTLDHVLTPSLVSPGFAMPQNFIICSSLVTDTSNQVNCSNSHSHTQDKGQHIYMAERNINEAEVVL